MWSDPATPRPSRRKFSQVLWRLAIGQPVRDYNRISSGPTFFRSAKAVKNRPSLNPCRDWPGWVKIAWRVWAVLGAQAVLTAEGLNLWGRILNETPPGQWIQPYLSYGGQASLVFAGGVFLVGFRFNRKTRKKDHPPDHVEFDPTLRGTVTRVPIGKIAGNKWKYIDFEKHPHLVVSSKTGNGKTRFLLAIVVWLVVHKAKVTLIDPKRTSFVLLRRIPGVTVHTAVEEWLPAIKRFHSQMQQTYKTLEQGESLPKGSDFHCLFIDEMGTFHEMINDYWHLVLKEKGEPPCFSELKQVLWLGREARFNLVIGAHQANARVMLSTDSRANFCNKVGLGYIEKESWANLFGNERRIRYKNKAGRGLLFTGDEFTEIQGIDMSKEEAHSVLSGFVLSYDNSTSPPPGDNPTLSYDKPSDMQDDSLSIQDGLVVGRKAGAEYCGMTLVQFDKRRQRVPIPNEKREGRSPAWERLELDRWAK